MYEYITVLGNKKGSELERDRSEDYICSGEMNGSLQGYDNQREGPD